MTPSMNPMIPRHFQVIKNSSETQDTFTLELKQNGSTPSRAFQFAPGQFNMLYVYGVGEVPISISGDPGRPDILVHTIRDVGMVTNALRNMKSGDTVGVRGPFGNPWPVDKMEGSDVVLVAGGIGLAPLRPSMYRILSRRGKYGKVVLLYGARTPEDILFREELEHWRAMFDLEVHVTVDRATEGWRSNVGVVTRLIQRAPFDPIDTAAMICGPEIMMRFTTMELASRGVQEEQIYISMERNMKCGVGLCGHCQLGPGFVCKEGPVYRFDEIHPIFQTREV